MQPSTRIRIRLAIALTAVTAACFAVTGVALAGSSCHREPTEAHTTTVELSALCFTPTITHVQPGDTVEFVNRDSFAHNVVGHGVRWGGLDQLAGGQRATTVFDAAGIYPYTCTIHPGMVGAIVVDDDGAEALGDASTAAPMRAETMPGSWGAVALAVGVPVFALVVWRWSHRPDSAES